MISLSPSEVLSILKVIRKYDGRSHEGGRCKERTKSRPWSKRGNRAVGHGENARLRANARALASDASSGFELMLVDPERADSRFEGLTWQAKLGRRAGWSGDPPFALS